MPVVFNGERLRNERESQNRTQLWLSLKTGISERYIRMLERGARRNPSAVKLQKICNALEIDVEDLLEMTKGKDGNTE